MVDTTGFITSLVINFAIALVATGLFVNWRGKYPWCYDTRRNPLRRKTGSEPPSVPDGSFDWLPKVLRLTDAEVMETAGLDGLMFIKFFECCAQLFSALSVLGIGVLLPVNFTAGGGITDSFDKLSMANIPESSRLFWVHLIIAYLFCGVFYYLTYHVWQDYLNLRHQFLAKWSNLGGNHTILVHNLPEHVRSDPALLAYFNKLYPGQVRGARMAKDLTMVPGPVNLLESLQENVADRNAIEGALEHNVAEWEKTMADAEMPEAEKKRPLRALKCFCCTKVDAIDHNYSELERLNKIVADKKQQMTLTDGVNEKTVPTLMSGFVTFHSVRSAYSASGFVYDTIPNSFEVKMAPECRDIFWPNLNFTHAQRTSRTLIFNVLSGALISFFLIIVTIIQGVSNLTGLAEKYPEINAIMSLPPIILGFIEAYLPAIIVTVCLILVPIVLMAWSRGQGIEAESWLQKSLMHKYFIFIVVNFFFGSIVGSSLLSNLSGLLGDIGSVPTVLGQTIPKAANFFVNYVALAAFAGFPLQMAQVGRLLVGGILKKYLALTPREFEAAEAPPELEHGVQYCNHLFIFIIAMTYAFIAPIILPFAACYFILGWIVFKYQVVHVFVQSFESGGTFWPAVYAKMSTCLLIAQICLVGIFGLKKVPAQAVLVIPLPIITILFDRYIHSSIKVKLTTLPLDQIVEIDAARKAERLAKQDAADAKLASASSFVSAPSKVSPSPDGLVVFHTGATEEQFNNGTQHSTSSYLVDHLGVDGRTLNVRALAAVGFPYEEDQQDRAYVEGDLAAYIQPELTPLVPARIEVNRADQHLTTAAPAKIRVAESANNSSTSPVGEMSHATKLQDDDNV